jgi:hypothetical protein
MEENSALAKSNASVPDVWRGIDSIIALEHIQRIAKVYCSASHVPREYQGQAGFGNAIIACSRALRLGVDASDLMQNSYFIQGRLVLSTPFMIGIINSCGRFSPLRFVLTGEGDTMACYAIAKDLSDGEPLKGPTITMAMAKAEGWLTKGGSKWRTMPEQMIRFRAASFWSRLYASDILLGMHTQEEAIDIEEVTVSAVSDLNAKVAEQPKPEPVEDGELF